jgi:hypothetical protein
VSHLDRTARQLVPGGRLLLAWGSSKFRTAQRVNTAAPLGILKFALWQRFPVVIVNEAYTSKYAYEAEEKLYKVWSDEKGKVVRGLLWHEDTTSPEWSCFVGHNQNAALNIHGLLVRGEANRPFHLSRVPGRGAGGGREAHPTVMEDATGAAAQP